MSALRIWKTFHFRPVYATTALRRYTADRRRVNVFVKPPLLIAATNEQ